MASPISPASSGCFHPWCDDSSGRKGETGTDQTEGCHRWLVVNLCMVKVAGNAQSGSYSWANKAFDRTNTLAPINYDSCIYAIK